MEKVIDHSVRIKVTNDCQWTCTFCHNEGTELPERQTKEFLFFLIKMFDGGDVRLELTASASRTLRSTN